MSDQSMSNSLFCVHPPSKKIFLATLRRFQSNSPSLSFAREPPALVRAMHTLSTLHTRAWLPISTSKLNRPSAPAFFDIFRTHKSHVNLCVITEDQRVPVWPFYAQIMGFTHHCSCGSCHLFPCLNLANLPHPARDSIFLSKLLLPSTG